jgi:HTH-like domain
LGSPGGSLDQGCHWWTFVISDTWRFGKRQDLNLLTADIIALATQYGRYGYRRIAAMSRGGWAVNLKRVERVWRREG